MSKPLHTWKIAVTIPLTVLNATNVWWEPTFESLGKPIPKQVSSGWHLKQIEEWLLLSSMCAVVCSYCMSHQHLDAKMVNISHRDVWVVSHRNVWVGTYF